MVKTWWMLTAMLTIEKRRNLGTAGKNPKGDRMTPKDQMMSSLMARRGDEHQSEEPLH